MDNPENTIILILSLISSVAILMYYLNSKQSICYDCKAHISHHKENRFSITLNGEGHALCGKCYHKRQKQESLRAQNCFCCSSVFTTRMKIHEWQTHHKIYFLCSTCNKKAEKKLKSNFKLTDVLTDNFIKANTHSDSLQEYIDTSGVKIKSQVDLTSQEWNAFVAKSSKFTSWKTMEYEALSELYAKNRSSIIEALRQGT